MARQRFNIDEDLAYGLLGSRVAAPVAPPPPPSPPVSSPAPAARAANPWAAGRVVDPLTNAYFGPVEMGDGQQTLGSGNGTGFLSSLATLPGREAFYRVDDGRGENANGDRIDRAALADYLSANGLKIKTLNENDLDGGARKYGADYRWLEDANGNLVGNRDRVENTSVSDMQMLGRIGLIAATAGLGGPAGIGNSLYGLQGAAGAAAGGATIGGVTGAVNAASNGENILKGAARGAVTGGATSYIGSELGGLLDTGAVSGMDMAADAPAYWNNLPNVEPGLLTTSSTLPELSAPDLTRLQPMQPIDPITIADVPAFDPARLNGADLGDLTLTGAPDTGLLGNGDPYAPDPTPVPAPAPMPAPVPQPDYVVTDRGVVDMAGNPAQTPAPVPDPVVMAPPAPEPGQYRPSENYGDGLTGRQTGAYDSVIKATGSPELANAASNAVGAASPVGDAWDWLKANPQAARLIFAGLGATAGGSGGGGGNGYVDSGYRPVITRNPTINPQPQFQQQQQPMQGLISLPTTGQANDGAWRYMKGLI